MKKYMGNKSKILGTIYSEAEKLCPEAQTVFDTFSGTTNVKLSKKGKIMSEEECFSRRIMVIE